MRVVNCFITYFTFAHEVGVSSKEDGENPTLVTFKFYGAGHARS